MKSQISIHIDKEILAGIEQDAEFLREKRGDTIQRACLEYLQRKGVWPPKKEAK